MKQPEDEAKEIALAIELFTNGSLNTFAMNTNVNTSNSLICYDILELGKQLQPIGMLVVLDSILNRITANRTKGKILIFSLMKYIYYSNMNILQISYLHFGNELENMELSAQV